MGGTERDSAAQTTAVSDHHGMTRSEPPDAQQKRKRRLVLGGIFVWLVIGILVGELRDPPFDIVRVVFRLFLAALMAWFLSWVFTSFTRGER